MPIYAYRCSDCGFQKDVLQKVSDPVLTDCPECGKSTFAKMLTAAGFQLKGTGWYATDFRNGSAPKDKTEGDAKTGEKTDKADKTEKSEKVEKSESSTPAARTETSGGTTAGTTGSTGSTSGSGAATSAD